MTKPTWTYTPQKDFVRATILDEQGDLLAVVHNLDNDEANAIASLIAAAPRLLAVAQSIFDSWITCGDVSVIQFDTLSKAIKAATECEVSE